MRNYRDKRRLPPSVICLFPDFRLTGYAAFNQPVNTPDSVITPHMVIGMVLHAGFKVYSAAFFIFSRIYA